MVEKRLGILYIWNKLLDHLGLVTRINDRLGYQLWENWTYGEFAKLWILHSVMKCEGSFSTFLEEYGVVELLGKEEWDFEMELIEQLLRPQWPLIYKLVAASIQDKSDTEASWHEWYRISSRRSLVMHSKQGYPLSIGGAERPAMTYMVVRGEKAIEKAFSQSTPFIGYGSLPKSEWIEREQLSQPLHFVLTRKKVEYIEEKNNERRTIYVSEHEINTIPTDLEQRLEELKKRAGEWPYVQGLYWLDRELKMLDPKWSAFLRNVKVWTTRTQGRAVLHWKIREDRGYLKPVYKMMVTNLPEEDSPTPELIDFLEIRQRWKGSNWLNKLKNPLENDDRPDTYLAVISWALEHYLLFRISQAGLSEQVISDDSIARIRWREQEVYIPGQASRMMTRIFPED
ncbi:hypothetical protein [Ammoniphilus sp. YIM 78166]|uniref:hypothetical protein n=1 Tax=Ammoniphilus sp. YIM 78166 TaxID=1644106 RepID=UPI0010705C0B|nr:hypothetical protein [Ammoniphilus sp. YIM 78166]